ncbi:hypothetical protein NBRC116493_35660 [Aurantivibrio infirmus]
MKDKFWNVIKATGTFIAVVIACTQLWDWFNESAPRPVAKLSHQEYYIEPSFITELRDFSSKLPEVNQPLLEHILDEIRFGYDKTEGVWLIDVTNEGGVVANSVKLKIPNAKSVAIFREGLPGEYTELNEIIELGELQPHESLSLRAWTNSDFYDEDDFRITHEGGIGTVVVFEDAAPLWVWLSNNWKFLLWMTVIVMLFIVSRISWVSKKKT